MELLEGQTLQHRLAAAPPKVEEIVDWSLQLEDEFKGWGCTDHFDLSVAATNDSAFRTE